MSPMPHDVVDLRLAPVALQLDQRLEELGQLSARDLVYRVELDNNRPAKSSREREQDLLATVTRLIELGGWNATWHERGVRLAHEQHAIVLGVPANLRDYLATAHRTSPPVLA